MHSQRIAKGRDEEAEDVLTINEWDCIVFPSRSTLTRRHHLLRTPPHPRPVNELSIIIITIHSHNCCARVPQDNAMTGESVTRPGHEIVLQTIVLIAYFNTWRDF